MTYFVTGGPKIHDVRFVAYGRIMEGGPLAFMEGFVIRWLGRREECLVSMWLTGSSRVSGPCQALSLGRVE
jgi:hypothetical protein